MDAEKSEGLFASYLMKHKIKYQRHYKVHGERNVDFKIESSPIVLCDVKEVRDSKKFQDGKISTYKQIRGDLNCLRKKFKTSKPQIPVVLVTINFSSNFFTALTVVQAMFGDIGVQINDKRCSEIHYLPKGNASLTRSSNTSISGILVYDYVAGNHRYFINPYATQPLPVNYFPEVEELIVTKHISETEFTALSKIMYWENGSQKT